MARDTPVPGKLWEELADTAEKVNGISKLEVDCKDLAAVELENLKIGIVVVTAVVEQVAILNVGLGFTLRSSKPPLDSVEVTIGTTVEGKIAVTFAFSKGKLLTAESEVVFSPRIIPVPGNSAVADILIAVASASSALLISIRSAAAAAAILAL